MRKTKFKLRPLEKISFKEGRVYFKILNKSSVAKIIHIKVITNDFTMGKRRKHAK